MGGLLGVFGPAAADAPLAGAVRGPGYALGGEVTHRGRYAVAFTGELHNRARLREILLVGGGSDADLVAAAHRRWGGDAPQYLRGSFAYLVRDSRTGRITGARDRFGVRPLFYARRAGSLFVAADQRALTDLIGGARTVDPAALTHYLTMQFVPEPMTMARSVTRLPVASTFECAAGEEIAIRRYWRPRLAPARRTDPVRLPADLRTALRESIKAQLTPGESAGVPLTGGIEAAGLAVLAAEVEPGVRGFSVGFDAPGYHPVSASAWQSAMSVTDVMITAADVIAELPRIVAQLADPVADPAAVPLYFVAREASRQVDVLLSAAGADELFGGHAIYREPLSLAPLTALPVPVRRGLWKLARRLPAGTRGRGMVQRAAVDLAERYHGNARIFTAAEKAALLRRHDARVRHTDVTGPVYAELPPGTDGVTAMQHVDLRTWLPGDVLATAERITAAHGLRLRTPYLDPAVYAFAARLPSRQKVGRYGQTKRALRRALAGLVPPGAAAEQGLRVPTRAWLRGDLGEWADTVLAGSAAGDLLNLEHARGLLREHRTGAADNARKVWTAVIFCLWHALFIEDARVVGAARPKHLAGVERVF